jgi:23S rRNA (uracil1939-C5)-methyltransferase
LDERFVKELLDQILPPLTIETLINGGSGLARYEGRVVFIPHTAVGDLVSCRVTRVKKNYLEAELIDVLEPGPQRIAPACPVAGDCGGCQLQHLPYTEQLRVKEELFRETLVRGCGIDAELVKPIVPSTQPWNYRSRAQIKCQCVSGTFITGFYRAKSRHVVAVEHCPLIADELNRTLARVRELIDGTACAAQIVQLDLALGDDGKQSLVVHYRGGDRSAMRQLLVDAQLECDILLQLGSKSSLTVIQGDGKLSLCVDDPPLKLNYATGSFSQINLDQNRRLVEATMGLVAWRGDETVVDLYCGMGNFSLPLARRAARVVGVEESQLSIATARENATRNELGNALFHAVSAEGFLSGLGQELNPEVVLIDPPRSGAYAVMQELLASSASKLLYVSCDPQTLARDLSALIDNGWSLVSSQPFDMFPQTFHCESVSLLVRES